MRVERGMKLDRLDGGIQKKDITDYFANYCVKYWYLHLYQCNMESIY